MVSEQSFAGHQIVLTITIQVGRYHAIGALFAHWELSGSPKLTLAVTKANEHHSRRFPSVDADQVQVANSTLRTLSAQHPDRADELRDLMSLVFQEQAIRRELKKLRRVRMSFMSWKLVHVPIAIVLSGLVVVHVLSVWKY